MTVPPGASGSRTTVVVITRNRVDQLLTGLDRLQQIHPEVPVVVVDNGSDDGTSVQVRRHFPVVDVVSSPRNAGAAGRTLGVRRARTPYVAFADDDSWWAPDSLERAADLLDAHPEVGLLAAHLLVEPGSRPDPVCAQLESSPLGVVPGVGPVVLGFLACAAVVRTDAYLGVGGFHRRFGVGGEETLLAIDLARAGRLCAYSTDVVAHHQPSPDVRPGRPRVLVRNALWTTWLRRPAGAALRATGSTAAAVVGDRARLAGLVQALWGLPWVLRQRHPVGADLARWLELLDDAAATGSQSGAVVNQEQR